MSDGKTQPGSTVLIAALVVLGVYVFFPTVILVPMIIALEHHWISESLLQALSVIFAPLEFLANHAPPYKQMIEAEFEFCKRMGWIHISA